MDEWQNSGCTRLTTCSDCCGPRQLSTLVLHCLLFLSLPCLATVGHVYLAGVQATLWDLGGQEDLRTLWDKVQCMVCVGSMCVGGGMCG